MNPSLQKDLDLLDMMKWRCEQLEIKLLNKELPHHERQIMEVALLMLKEIMTNKLRDVRRRLREVRKY